MIRWIAYYGMYLASAVFIVGLAGSAIVVLISFVEDFYELFSEDSPAEANHPHPPAS